MERERLGKQVEELSEQVGALLEQAQSELSQQPGLLLQALEELNVTVEELQVSQEELYEQNQELEAAREAVEIERQRYQELFEFAPEGYLVTDTSGKIWKANRTASQLLNVSQQYLVGKPLTVFFVKEERQAFWSTINRLPEVGRLQEWSVRLQPRNGIPFDASLTVTTVDDLKGKIIALRWLLRDITERKQLEEAQLRAKLVEMNNQDLQKEITQRRELEEQLREQAEKLTQANHLKDEFLAIVSHELRSPLNAMLGWSQMLRGRQLNEAMMTCAIETIERNARIQAQLIEDLLDISSIIKGKLHLNIRPVNLVGVIESAIATVQPAASAKTIEIQTMLASSACLVSGDSERLHQFVWNLLANAIKFTPKQGRVEVQLECISSSAVLTVSDTGKGISPDFLPYVFECFRQAERATTRFYGGLGLGLAIVKHLVEMHGGTVCADSPGEGQGTTFTVRIPLMTMSL